MTGSRYPGPKWQNSSKDIVLKKHGIKTIHERERLNNHFVLVGGDGDSGGGLALHGVSDMSPFRHLPSR